MYWFSIRLQYGNPLFTTLHLFDGIIKLCSLGIVFITCILYVYYMCTLCPINLVCDEIWEKEMGVAGWAKSWITYGPFQWLLQLWIEIYGFVLNETIRGIIRRIHCINFLNSHIKYSLGFPWPFIQYPLSFLL